MNTLTPFFEKLEQSYTNDTFVKITLSKPIYKSDGLHNVYIRLITIKGAKVFSWTYHYQTNDQVKNYTLAESKTALSELLSHKFKAGILFALDEDFTIQFSKKGKVSTRTSLASFKNKPPETHDRPKKRRAELGKYLTLLGITDSDGVVIPKMSDKYKQINKYLEIIEGLMKNTDFPKTISIVDMGAGKGYLTFALYDYLVNQRKKDVVIKGIEVREDLVDFCNRTAQECGFNGLSFVCQTIQDYQPQSVDVLIALHACDTATDDALGKAINANAKLVITAPCCHKQIRQQLKGRPQENPILNHGIFKERQYEMVTDTIRALILEQHQYTTKIFEFISNEHTRKNVMLVGQKSIKRLDDKIHAKKIQDLKDEYGITSHYLEEVVSVKK